MIVKENINSVFKPKDIEELKKIAKEHNKKSTFGSISKDEYLRRKKSKPHKWFWKQFSEHFDVPPYFNVTEKGKNWTAFIFTFDLKHEYYEEEEIEEWIEENTFYDVHYVTIQEIGLRGSMPYTLYKVFVYQKGIKFNWT